jgi:hypothetical protein
MSDTASNPPPPYPPFPPYPPYPPYPPVVVVVPCHCCHSGSGSPRPVVSASTGTQASVGSQPTAGTSSGSGSTGPTVTPSTSTYDTIGFTIASNPSDNEDGGGFGGFAGIADGVSADSSVTAALYLAGSSSSPFQTITLKTSSEAPWSALVPMTATFPLHAAVSATSLGSVTISFIPGSEPGDRWSIQSVQVVLSSSRGAPAPQMLVDQSDGVAVLTSSHPSVTLSL